MITLYGFGRVNPMVHGLTRDLRAQWMLEETGLPYQVRGLDHTGGEMKGEAYTRIACFQQLPVIDDDGFLLAESGAILMYLAEKSGQLMPTDPQGRARVAQWLFAALATVERPLLYLALLDMGAYGTGGAPNVRAGLLDEAHRVLAGLERRLDGREWIACDTFTIADLLFATILRKCDLLGDYPRVHAYQARANARPAWARTQQLYADRLGIPVANVR